MHLTQVAWGQVTYLICGVFVEQWWRLWQKSESQDLGPVFFIEQDCLSSTCFVFLEKIRGDPSFIRTPRF